MANKYYGLYQGIVTSIKDPEKRGRIKVQCPEVLGGDEESAWCDPLVPVAYDYGGDFFIPPLGEAVWLQFIAGDSNRPVWQGGWWQTNMTPIGNDYSKANQVRIINYADCTIAMQNGTININVGEETAIKIEQDKVTVNGDLIVTGRISSSV